MAKAESTPDEDPARQRFREALERKRGGAGGNGGLPHDPGKSVAHTSTVTKRQFRRKSG